MHLLPALRMATYAAGPAYPGEFMGRCLWGAGLAAVLAALPTLAFSADIVVKQRPEAERNFRLSSAFGPSGKSDMSGRSDTGTVIRLTGPLRHGDADAMKGLLADLTAPSEGKSIALVELSSLGGDLTEGLKLGYLFRDLRVATVVRRGDVCFSACALAFVGGTAAQKGRERIAAQQLEIGGKVAFHSFYLNAASGEAPTLDDPVRSRRQGFAEAQAATALMVRYAADLGIDSRFLASVMVRPPEEMSYVVTASDFLALGVCPIGLGLPAKSLAEQAMAVCANSVGDTGRVLPGGTEQLPPLHAKRQLLELVQENMATQKTTGVLFDQFASYSVMRVERSLDGLYADLRAVGVRLPELVGPVFRVSGQRRNGEPMQCFVSLSTQEPDRYSVSILERAEWVAPDRSAPRNCRGLFRHDADSVINPLTAPSRSSREPALSGSTPGAGTREAGAGVVQSSK